MLKKHDEPVSPNEERLEHNPPIAWGKTIPDKLEPTKA